MDKKTLALEIKKIALLKGYFLLRSGTFSKQYFDKYQIESRPLLLKALCHYMKNIIPKDTQILAGLEMGGIPLATTLSTTTSLPCVFVRKKAKIYGTKKSTEGIGIKGQKVCIVEDVITTGGQVIKSLQDMRNEGAIITDVICAILRGNEDVKNKMKQQFNLTLGAVFTKTDFL